jgi:hypothetical protein
LARISVFRADRDFVKPGRSAARREGKGAVKKMEGVFEDIAFETDQMPINATEYCD